MLQSLVLPKKTGKKTFMSTPRTAELRLILYSMLFTSMATER